jgi:hypothetical protein
MSGVIAPRPNLFTHLGFALTLYLMLQFQRTAAYRHLAWLIPLYAIWPNFHYGFAMGFVLIALFVVSAVLDNFLPIARRRPVDPILLPRALSILLACAIAACLNPYGVEVYTDLVTMTLKGSAANVSEWLSPDFHALHGRLLLASILSFIALRMFSPRPERWIEVTMPLLMLSMALTSVRHIPFWALVLPALAAQSLGRVRTFPGFDSGLLRSRCLAPGDLGQRASRFVNAFVIALTLGIVAASANVVERRFADQSAAFLPKEAISFLLRESVSGRLFNTYGGGGYIIWRAGTQLPVFIDGRYSPYPQDVIDHYHKIARAEPGTLDLLRKYDVEVIVYKTNSGLTTLLSHSSQYRPVYSDFFFTVFVEDAEQYALLRSVPLEGL